MKKSLLIGVLATILLATASPAEAQQLGKIFRIGILDSSNASGSAVLVDSFRQELSKLGWIEGKNIAFEYRFGENKGTSHLSALAADLVRLKVDLIVATGSPPTRAAKNATSSIPIVMAANPDPVGFGFVASLARPGGNVTGFSSMAFELGTKRLEILKDAVPKLARVGLLRVPAQTGLGARQLKELRPAAQYLKLKLQEIETEANPKSLEGAFQAAKEKRVQAIMTTATGGFFSERKRIVELATKYHLPSVYFEKEFVDEGGLMFYGVNYEDLFRKSAHYVDKILKGAKPADLPVEQATKFEFVISLPAAKQIGLTIPPEVLSRANRVIK